MKPKEDQLNDGDKLYAKNFSGWYYLTLMENSVASCSEGLGVSIQIPSNHYSNI